VPRTKAPAQLIAELEETRRALKELQQQRAAETAARLMDQAASDALDPDTVRLLIRDALNNSRTALKEQANALADGGLAAIERAVADLRRTKPFLFTRPAPAPSPAAASPALPVHDDDQRLRDAAVRARNTGDRRDLLHYLRIRRAK
jgi:hypothetical protein